MAQALSNDDPWWYSGIVLPIMTLSCLLWPARSDFFSRCRNSRQDDWEKDEEGKSHTEEHVDVSSLCC